MRTLHITIIVILALLASYLPAKSSAMYGGPGCNEIHLPWYPLSPYFGKTIAFVTNMGSSQVNNFTLYTVDTKSHNMHEIGRVPYPSAIAVSSDGTKMTFINQTDTADQIFSANINGSDIVQLTHDNESRSIIGITPDGKKIVYSIHYGGPGRISNYYAIDSDGKNPRQITNDTMRKGETELSYDGSTLVFNDDSRQPRIFSVRTDGSDFHYITNGSLFSHTPLISANGSKIAFSRDNPQDSNSKYIYTINTDGTDLTKISQKPIYFQSDFTISLDGSKVAFDDNTGNAYYISVVNSDGTGYRQLNNFDYYYSHTALFSSDGSRVVYSSGNPTQSLFISDLKSNSSSSPITSSIVGFEKEINPNTAEVIFPEILQGGMGIFTATPDGKWFSLIDNSVFKPNPNCRLPYGGPIGAKIQSLPIPTDPVLNMSWYERVNGWTWTGVAAAGVVGFWAFYFVRYKER